MASNGVMDQSNVWALRVVDPSTQNQKQNTDGHVWVVFPIARNIETARRFGQVKYAFDNTVKVRGRRRIHIRDLGHRLYRQLIKPFNPQKDFLLLAGSTLLLTMATASLIEEYEAVKVLHYDNQAQEYVPVKLTPYDWNWGPEEE